MASFDFSQCDSKQINRVDPKPHKDNKNVIMSSVAMYYGGPKQGKTRTLTTVFKGSDYIFLDFDSNYDSMRKKIETSGGQYFNGDNAFRLVDQLLMGTITNQVVILDAMNDIKMYMMRKVIEMEKDEDVARELTRVLKSGKIGNMQEETSTWYKATFGKMVNNSNSINVIHHTTASMGGEKMEGNQAAYMSKFDITYMIKKDESSGDSYFELVEQRDLVAPQTLNMNKGIDEAVKEAVRLFKSVQNEDNVVELSGMQIKNDVKRRMPKWSDVFSWQTILKTIATVKKVGKFSIYTLREDITFAKPEEKLDVVGIAEAAVKTLRESGTLSRSIIATKDADYTEITHYAKTNYDDVFTNEAGWTLEKPEINILGRDTKTLANNFWKAVKGEEIPKNVSLDAMKLIIPEENFDVVVDYLVAAGVAKEALGGGGYTIFAKKPDVEEAPIKEECCSNGTVGCVGGNLCGKCEWEIINEQ